MSLAPKYQIDYSVLIKKVSQIVAKISGNVLEEKQALMVQTRVKKRMSELGLSLPEEYLSYLETHENEEAKVLVSLLTTHHTFFFREFAHFEHLKKMLPEIIIEVKKRGDKKIKIWSAACSRGQEVYSLSMFFNFYLPKLDPSLKFEITGSDIDPESVKFAGNGVYNRKEIKSVPMNYLGDHWARGTGDISEFVKAKKTLTEPLKWKVINLLNFSSDMRNEKFDIIFCRNVFIYFRPEQIKAIMNGFITHLYPKGVFYSGISESLGALNLQLKNIGPSVYSKFMGEVEEKKAASKDLSAPRPLAVAKAPAALTTLPSTLKVLCVDDSSSILTLLKKVFGSGTGFEVVGVAKNGLEAIEMVKKTTFDVMTLDIHMPEMDGITYLENHFSQSHPPVVMISSASRDDSSAAMRALRAGASDFIEKPSLNNLLERGEEIKTKLKVAYMDRRFEIDHVSSIDKDFEHEIVIAEPEKAIRIIMSSMPDQKKVEKFFRELNGKQPPTVMFFEGQDNILEAIRSEIRGKIRPSVEMLDTIPENLNCNTVYLADFQKMYEKVLSKFVERKTSVIVFGKCSKHAGEKILNWSNAQLLVEDMNHRDELTDVATDVVPSTSFAYMSAEYLSRK